MDNPNTESKPPQKKAAAVRKFYIVPRKNKTHLCKGPADGGSLVTVATFLDYTEASQTVRILNALVGVEDPIEWVERHRAIRTFAMSDSTPEMFKSERPEGITPAMWRAFYISQHVCDALNIDFQNADPDQIKFIVKALIDEAKKKPQ